MSSTVVALVKMSPWRALVIATVLLATPFKILSEEGNCVKHDDSTRPDCLRAIAFFSKLQTAFQKSDRNTVASLVRYPLLTTRHSKKVYIGSRAELLAHYDEIFDAGVRCAVLNASAKEVWGNWQGFMIGRGDIWFDSVIPPNEKADPDAPDFWTKRPFKIITVNNGSPGDAMCKPQ